jgi:hypothetical protein
MQPDTHARLPLPLPFHTQALPPRASPSHRLLYACGVLAFHQYLNFVSPAGAALLNEAAFVSAPGTSGWVKNTTIILVDDFDSVVALRTLVAALSHMTEPVTGSRTRQGFSVSRDARLSIVHTPHVSLAKGASGGGPLTSGVLLSAVWNAVASAGSGAPEDADAAGPLLHAIAKLALTAAGQDGGVPLADVLVDVKDVLEVRGSSVSPAVAAALRGVLVAFEGAVFGAEAPQAATTLATRVTALGAHVASLLGSGAGAAGRSVLSNSWALPLEATEVWGPSQFDLLGTVDAPRSGAIAGVRVFIVPSCASTSTQRFCAVVCSCGGRWGGGGGHPG